MKVLTKHSDYAIRALMGLARQPDLQAFVTVKALAGQEQIPYAFLRRIMQVLLKAGYVRVREGRAGGFQLQQEPADIRILDLIRLFQGEIVLSECMFRKKLCGNRATCVLRHEILRIEQLVNQEFGAMTLQGLLDKLGGK